MEERVVVVLEPARWREGFFGGVGGGVEVERERRLDLLTSTIRSFSCDSLLSLLLFPTRNAPAQPQEVARRDGGIVAEEVDDQVAAGGLDEDRHEKKLRGFGEKEVTTESEEALRATA